MKEKLCFTCATCGTHRTWTWYFTILKDTRDCRGQSAVAVGKACAEHKAACVRRMAETKSVTRVQRKFRITHGGTHSSHKPFCDGWNSVEEPHITIHM
jgi:hypothetical protein